MGEEWAKVAKSGQLGGLSLHVLQLLYIEHDCMQLYWFGGADG